MSTDLQLAADEVRLAWEAMQRAAVRETDARERLAEAEAETRAAEKWLRDARTALLELASSEKRTMIQDARYRVDDWVVVCTLTDEFLRDRSCDLDAALIRASGATFATAHVVGIDVLSFQEEPCSR